MSALALVADSDPRSVEERLADLADVIDSWHQDVREGLRQTAIGAREAGRALNQAKALLVEQHGHGQWLTWLTENTKFDVRTAQTYMRVARLVGDQNLKNVTLEQTLEWFATPKQTEPDEAPNTQAPTHLPAVEPPPFELQTEVARPSLKQESLPGGALYTVPVIADWIALLRGMPTEHQERSRDALVELRDQINAMIGPHQGSR